MRLNHAVRLMLVFIRVEHTVVDVALPLLAYAQAAVLLCMRLAAPTIFA